MFRFFNPNPAGKFVGDCTIRAICKLLDKDWDEVYAGTVLQGFFGKDMPSGNSIWGAYLKRKGFIRKWLPDTCPDCYTVEDFVKDFPRGVYVLGFGGHVATVIDGNLYDSWNSLQEVPVYFWYRK